MVKYNSLKEKVYPLLDDFADITKRANSVTEKIEGYIEEIENQIFSVKDKLIKFKEFGTRNKPENRIQELYKNLNALKKGITAFWEKFSNK